MRLILVVASSVLTLVLATPLAVAQGVGTRGTPGTQERGYSSDSTDFVVGKHVHLRSTKTFIGVILAVDDNHSFPADRFPRAKMKAVLIERRDGPLEWVPLERINRIYRVK